MRRTRQYTLLTPRLWALAALLCVAGWVAIGYHLDQIRANFVLGQMAGDDLNLREPMDEYEALRKILFFASFAFLLIAACLKYRSLFQIMKSRKTSAKESEPTEVAQSEAFQPILTQEEIGDEDAEAIESQSGRRRVSRVVTQIAQGGVRAVRPVKSRQ